MRFLKFSLPVKIAFLLFIITLSIYVFGANRHNPGYADSDEMITIGYLLGSAHPSGYPLQMWLTKLFTLLPITGSIAYRANIMNSFFHALTVIAMFATGFIVIQMLLHKKENYDKMSKIGISVSLIGSSLLGFSGLFWLYSGVAEVGALNDFLGSVTLLSSLVWYSKVSSSKTYVSHEYVWFLLTWALAGLGMTHVHTFILLYPGLGVVLLIGLFKYGRFKLYGWMKLLLPLLVYGICFFVPNLSLFYLNDRKQNVSWYFEQSWQGWWGHISRKVYSGYIPEKDIHVASYISKINIPHYINAFPHYWDFMIQHFSIIGVIFGLFGLSWLWIKNKELALIITSFVLVSGMVLALYMGVPDPEASSLEYRSLIGISHRQYLIGETMWAIAMIIGLWGIVELVRKEFKKITIEQLGMIVGVLGFLSVLTQFLYNLPMGNQRNNTHAWDYAKAVLEPLPQDAILMCFADFSCFSLMYAQEVEGLRPDVKLVSKNIFIKGHWLKQNPELKGLEDTDNPYFSADIVSWNLFNNRRVFLTDSVGYYVSYIGLEGNPFFIVPNGLTFEVVKKMPQTVPSFNYPITEKLLAYKRPSRDYWFAGQMDYFSNFHTINALVYSYLNLKDDAMRNLKYSLTLTPNYATAQNIYNGLPAYQGNLSYHLGQEGSSSAYFINQAKDYIQKKQFDPAYKYLQKATFLDPKDIESRSMLAELLVMGKFYREARMEYKNILRFHPDQKEIEKRIAQLEGMINQP